MSPSIPNGVNPTLTPVAAGPIRPFLIGHIGSIHVLPLLFHFTVHGVKVAKPYEISRTIVLHIKTNPKSADILFAQSPSILPRRICIPGFSLNWFRIPTDCHQFYRMTDSSRGRRLQVLLRLR